MRCASIDIGSNTVRLLVADHIERLVPIIHKRSITRLARDIDASGMLDKQAVEETIEALIEFSGIINSNDIDFHHVMTAGTSALREAADGNEFIEKVSTLTGLDIQVLAPEDEARAMALGVLDVFPELENAFLLDIGGGSTEAIYINDGHIISSHSVATGVVKLIDGFLHSDPPDSGELNSLNAQCRLIASEMREGLSVSIDLNSTFIATAGTATTAASIEMKLERYDHDKVNGYIISLKRLTSMLEHLQSLKALERRRVIGLEPGRADLIIPGLMLTNVIMREFGFNELKVSDSGLLEGLCIMAARKGIDQCQ